MMTISDYVQALQVCRKQGVSMLDLSTRTITGENESACDGEREREGESVCDREGEGESWCKKQSVYHGEREGESVYDGEREGESVCDREGEGESWCKKQSVCDGEGESVCLCVAKGIMSDEKIWGGKEENRTARKDMKIIREKETKL